MSFLPRLSCLLLCLLPSVSLLAQLAADTRKVQWAGGIRYGVIFNGASFEFPQTGERESSGYHLDYEVEARFSDRWSAFLVLRDETIDTWRTNVPAGNPFVADPEFVAHPFTSSLESASLQLGGQYSYRIGSGDLSLALAGGVQWSEYARVYDLITEYDGQFISGGFAVDGSASATFLVGTLRLQYTYWLSRSLAIGTGVQSLFTDYRSGGRETPLGPRYEMDYIESGQMPVLYDVNYDVTSLSPDPTRRVNRFGWFITLASRI